MGLALIKPAADGGGGGGDGGDPTSFLFNPDGTQAGNVYNDWGDLDAALQAAPGRRTVYLASETLDAFGRMVAEVPAGSYDWSAVGFSTASNSLAGATLRVGDGVTITNMDGLRLEGLVTLEFVNDAGPVATLPASTRWGITLDSGTIVAKGDAVPISMPNASSFIGFILDNEAGLIRGTTPQGNTEGTQAIVNSADASNGIFVTMGLKSWATDNLFTGTVGFFAYRCGSTSVNPATITNAGLTVSYNGSALITYAANLAYDNTDSGLAAGNVQAAIDEIVVSAGGGRGGGPSLTPGTDVSIPAWGDLDFNTDRVQVIPIQLTDTISSSQALVTVEFNTPFASRVGVALTPINYVESDTTSKLYGGTAVLVLTDGGNGYTIYSGENGIPDLVGGDEAYAWYVTVTPS